MTFRAATAADRPALEAFLLRHAARAMFPLANLLAHGVVEGPDAASGSGASRATRFWLAGDPILGALGLTEEGMALPVMPATLASEAARPLHGAALIGILGEAEAAQALRAALGLAGAPTRLDGAEPHYALELDRLRLPASDGLRLAPIALAPRERLLAWGEAYDVEALGADPAVARAEAVADLDAWVRADSHRVLWRGPEPVARTGFNAQAPDIVQVGGVWVPPALRNRGFARAAVALHLAEARAAGVRRATLFAATPAAARAYEALGFARVGDYLLCLFDGPRQACATDAVLA